MGSTRRFHPPSWTGEEQRRLQAYAIYRMYLDNVARYLLQSDEAEDQDDHREYGDPELIVSTISSAALGETQEVMVPGEQDENDDEHDLKVWLKRWIEKEHALEKISDEDRDAVSLGDGVLYLGWSAEKGRAVLRQCDPGFYFPVLDDDLDDYPRKVHLAWEEEDKTRARRWVRRITWELVPLESRQETNEEARQRLGFGRFGFVLPSDRLWITPDTWVWDEDRQAYGTRYPWTPAGELSYDRCVISDARFNLAVGRGVDDFDESNATYREDRFGTVYRRDLNIDFLPVIHIPNLPSKEHYGRSSLSHVLQVFDDMSATDTDLQRGAATAASPVIALSGATVNKADLSYTPGQVWETGDGRMNVMSTADALDPLLKLNDALGGRLSRNAQVPEALIGRIKPSEVPSGIALALGFAPMTALIRRLRLTRSFKYSLLLKFAWRISAANGVDVPEWVEGTHLKLGSYLPIDRTSVVNELRELLAVNGVSRLTGARMLQAIGYSIEDAVREVDQIIEDLERIAEAERGPTPPQLEQIPPGQLGNGSPAPEQEQGEEDEDS